MTIILLLFTLFILAGTILAFVSWKQNQSVLLLIFSIFGFLFIGAVVVGILIFSIPALGGYETLFHAHYSESTDYDLDTQETEEDIYLEITLPRDDIKLLEEFESLFFSRLGKTELFYIVENQMGWDDPSGWRSVNDSELKKALAAGYTFQRVARVERSDQNLLVYIYDGGMSQYNEETEEWGEMDIRVYEIRIDMEPPYTDPLGTLKDLEIEVNRWLDDSFPKEYRKRFK